MSRSGGGGGNEDQSVGVEPARTEWWKSKSGRLSYPRRKGAQAEGSRRRTGGRELLIGADGALEAITFELCKKIVVEV